MELERQRDRAASRFGWRAEEEYRNAEIAFWLVFFALRLVPSALPLRCEKQPIRICQCGFIYIPLTTEKLFSKLYIPNCTRLWKPISQVRNEVYGMSFFYNYI